MSKPTYSLLYAGETIFITSDRESAMEDLADYLLAHPEELDSLVFFAGMEEISGTDLEEFVQDNGMDEEDDYDEYEDD